MSMINVNFLTEKYKFKKFIKTFIIIIIIITIIILMLEMFAFAMISNKAKITNRKIIKVERRTRQIKSARVNVKKEIDKIPDLSDQIKILEDLFLDKDLRLSEILYEIRKDTAENIWYTDLDFNNDTITISGAAKYDYKNKRSPENTVFELEKKLKESGKFHSVKAEFLQSGTVEGHTVKLFKYIMKVRTRSVVPKINNNVEGG